MPALNEGRSPISGDTCQLGQEVVYELVLVAHRPSFTAVGNSPVGSRPPSTRLCARVSLTVGALSNRMPSQ